MTAAITTTYLYRSFKLEQNGLRDENLTSLGAEIANLGLEKLYLLSGSATTHLEKSVNDGVQVHVLLVRHCYYERTRGAGNELVCLWGANVLRVGVGSCGKRHQRSESEHQDNMGDEKKTHAVLHRALRLSYAPWDTDSEAPDASRIMGATAAVVDDADTYPTRMWLVGKLDRSGGTRRTKVGW